jgi:hypothetical protein
MGELAAPTESSRREHYGNPLVKRDFSPSSVEQRDLRRIRSGTLGYDDNRAGGQAATKGRRVPERAEQRAALRHLRPVSATLGLQVC